MKRTLILLAAATTIAMASPQDADIAKFIQNDDCPVHTVIDSDQMKIFRACKDTYTFAYNHVSGSIWQLDKVVMVHGKDGSVITLYENR